MGDRLHFQEQITEILDRACSELNARDFEILLQRLKEEIEDYQ